MLPLEHPGSKPQNMVAFATANFEPWINVEGLSHEKRQYLTRVLRENDIDVAVLQETHVKEASSPQRDTIHGYDTTDATYHPKYGTAT